MEKQNLLFVLQSKISEADRLLAKCDHLDDRIRNKAKFRRKLQAEKEFLLQFQQDLSKLSICHLVSTNLNHLSAICQTIEQCSNVVGILIPFRRSDDSSLVVDIVADGGASWLKVVARNARGLHMGWSGECGHGERNIVCQAQDYVSTSVVNHYMFKKPSVTFVFHSGVTSPLKAAIEGLGVKVIGNVSPVSDDYLYSEDRELETEAGVKLYLSGGPSQQLQSEDTASSSQCSQQDDRVCDDHSSFLNLDTTAMMVFVSALTNGHANLIFQQPLLNQQAECERKQPALPFVKKVMEGRKLICCRTAYDSFMNILNTVGGEGEKRRAEEWLPTITVVEDQLSEGAKRLQSGRRITYRSLAVFGTGDSLKVVTLTANRKFVHAALNQGVRFEAIFHESRALSEQKQIYATPLP